MKTRIITALVAASLMGCATDTGSPVLNPGIPDLPAFQSLNEAATPATAR